MSSPPAAPNGAPVHDIDKETHTQALEDDTRSGASVGSREWSARGTIRDAYYHLLFGIPFLYRNRIQRIIDTAHLSDSDLKLLMALNARNRSHTRRRRDLKEWLKDIETLEDWDGLIGIFPQWSMKLKLNPNPDEVTPVRQTIPLPSTGQPGLSSGGKLVLTEALETFHTGWVTFINNASFEWTTLNIVSALMLTAALTLLQISSAVANPATRTFVFLTLSSSITSIFLGCSYILRFSNMKAMRKAAGWLEDSQLKADNIIWNIWVLLSLPAVWLAWAAIEFCIAIFLLLWTIVPDPGNTVQYRLDTSQPTPTPPFVNIFGPRIAVTSTFLIGIVHIFLVIKTFLAWSGAGNTIDFDKHIVEAERAPEGEMPRPESFQLPSGSKRSSNVPLPSVRITQDEIPRAQEEEEQGFPLRVITSQRPSSGLHMTI